MNFQKQVENLQQRVTELEIVIDKILSGRTDIQRNPVNSPEIKEKGETL